MSNRCDLCLEIKNTVRPSKFSVFELCFDCRQREKNEKENPLSQNQNVVLPEISLKQKIVNYRAKNGTMSFSKNYKRKKYCPKTIICNSCNKQKLFYGRDEQKNEFCRTCYRQKFSLIVCVICKQKKPLHIWLSEVDAICSTCYLREVYDHKKFKCSFCQGYYIIVKNLLDGRKMCRKCYNKKGNKKKCFGCNKIRSVRYRDPENMPYCHTCYQRIFIPKNYGKCGICRHQRRLKYRDFEQGKICSVCYRKKNKSV
ncbi:hypothetical protein A2300_04440 [Candidatus Falkowbacteria bacterium RIFOXYB2_FULL_35_7]|uniref:Uncharacterized protein n=1 Tax=Candidatus Falkowbacteria bacterium RIFOXYC2_FULL_36_12 TaxID=1798002 RepID=A0A1F5SYI4_9BACT|nr:MAG: hypothetical protein A2300_04440 [Candidatus Falkowbacteria bacterium RIFOXYB2_FULL_35_7]OGF31709.1 MAG: hypothetical protein A2478_04450 [Candidatus Falkowbacteria bacterium RIFOXYC2_FULL_36_12]